MAIVQVHDKQFETYIGSEAIQQRVAALGKQISADYEGKNPLLIGILNGSFTTAGVTSSAVNSTVTGTLSIVVAGSW